ncbi:GPI ethanolamine phosphate transferase 2 [Euphorbia peplus]|nr:GPI ethanolamine phosphate transferase 2 [Euphorbia peplus]
MEGRRRKWIYCSIMAIHVIGILIFTRGFLLTRTELPYYSHSSDISQSPCFPPPSHNQSLGQHCWTKPAVDRVLIIVLDALRFDFVAPSSFFSEKKPWMDKLPVLQKMAFKQGSSSRIFKAIADPPTTSLQRLKGLTTGGLPTFIDVGNSFGAPAIVEDNFIHQLVENGKRVLMMGDDTWVQLFPDHFNRSYPYPSFNVKDLHTVDNGCIDHLFPSLHEEDWDVLIAHFLGVDHAGHIFGVDSNPMIEKLEQYNLILEKVIQELENQSGPGGKHENTLLLVMGDHGQTLNGDHGGGSAEEVDTSLFAMSFKQPPFSIPSELDTSSCQQDSDGKDMCISSIQQLDFAVTVSALLGVSFPFGSIGRVNPELYALGAGTWNLDGIQSGSCKDNLELQEWLHNYVNTLCINSWQVKRYIDVYSASSMIGFSSEDLGHISDIYNQAEENWSNTQNILLHKNESCNSLLPALTRQINAYFTFLLDVAELARSKWTEFNLKMMGTGFVVLLISLSMILFSIQQENKLHVLPSGNSVIPFDIIFVISVVAIRACSLFSNSYILEEGKVASFLLATIGIAKLRYSFMKKKMLFEAVTFLLLNSILRFSIEVGLSKQAATSAFMSASSSWMLWITPGHPVWAYISELGPSLILILLAWLLYRTTVSSYCWGIWKYIIMGTILSYILIALHWVSESNISSLVLLLERVGRSHIPRIVYAISLGQLLVAFGQFLTREKALDGNSSLTIKTLAMLSAWSSTVIVLSGKQGSLVALASIIGGYCIMRLDSMKEDTISGNARTMNFSPLAVTQWNLFAVCLFFATGHWCAFDGLRYGAAFVGFDEFILVRQAILLTIETFGFSIILPIFGLPVLVMHQYLFGQIKGQKSSVFAQLSQMYLMYGLITTATVTATIMCVTIQRRHLMVWGLFAPKFVFDVVGLMLTDVLICLALLFYSDS